MRTVISIGMLAVFLAHSGLAQMEPERPRESRLFDATGEPAYRMTLGLIPSSRFEGHGKSGTIEIESDWAFAYFWNVLGGDIDLSARLRSAFFTDSAELSLPNQVAQIAMNAGWTWRYAGGAALQVRALPGVYSDLEEFDADILRMPASCTAAKSFLPDLAGYAGLELRPGFERALLPIVGLDWTINEALRLRAGLPESALVYQVDQDRSAHVGMEWRSTTFALDGAPDRITLEDFRLFAGLKNMLADQFGLAGGAGYVFGRTAQFEDGGDVDVDGAWFVRAGIEGTF